MGLGIDKFGRAAEIHQRLIHSLYFWKIRTRGDPLHGRISSGLRGSSGIFVKLSSWARILEDLCENLKVDEDLRGERGSNGTTRIERIYEVNYEWRPQGGRRFSRIYV